MRFYEGVNLIPHFLITEDFQIGVYDLDKEKIVRYKPRISNPVVCDLSSMNSFGGSSGYYFVSGESDNLIKEG